MGDIGPGHVAADQDGVGVVWTYRWMEHGPTPAWPNDFEIARTGVASVCQDQQG